MADQVEEVKLKTDIVSLIGEHVNLKKAGRNYKGLCPFHNEKSPSFMVSPELQMYKCFGCGVSGDAYTFLQEFEGMEFSEALKFLADKAGVKLEPRGDRNTGEKEKLFTINSLATQFYQYMLWKHKEGQKALSYLLKERGLLPETIKNFKLGYSPDAPFALKSFLVGKKKIEVATLSQAGIVYVGDRGVFDRFRGRVLFPLMDHRGNVAGFAGRLLPGGRSDMAKYINTPETPVYHKSNLLYGLNFTKGEIKKKNEAVVVEGELDMISSWQAGIKNVIAIKGSALTEEQSKLLSRFTSNVVLALDADLAGDMASRRGIEIASKAGLEVKVAVLSGYKDPDEAARHDPEYLKKCIATAKNIWDFLVDSIFAHHTEGSGMAKAQISREVIPVLAAIPDSIVQAHYISLVSSRLRVPIDAVTEEIQKVAVSKKAPEVYLKAKEEKVKDRSTLLEDQLLALMFALSPEAYLEDDIVNLFKSPLNIKLVEELKKFLANFKKFDAAAFFEYLPGELKEKYKTTIFMNASSSSSEPEKYKEELLLVKRELHAAILHTQLRSLAEEIGNLEARKEKAALREKEKEFGALTKLLTTLESDS